MDDAVAQANENKPENAMIDGIRRQPTGKPKLKFPTVVKKPAVIKSAERQSATNSKKVNAKTHMESDAN